LKKNIKGNRKDQKENRLSHVIQGGGEFSGYSLPGRSYEREGKEELHFNITKFVYSFILSPLK
jgi:hypothetical protein